MAGPRDMTKANLAMLKKRNQHRDEDGLTPKERAFCLYYVGHPNRIGTEAAVSAGYCPGNRDGARRYSWELLKREPIQREIDRLTMERNKRLEIDADGLLQELLRLKTDVEACTGRTLGGMKARLDVLKTIGDHVRVGAFRKQVGLSSPTGGPIETVDAEWLADATDEELDALEHARAIIDRRAGKAATLPDVGGDQSGTGAAPEED